MTPTSLAPLPPPPLRIVFLGTPGFAATILRGLLRYERSPSLTFEGGGEVAYNMLEVDQAFTEGGVYDEEGRLCSHATGTFKYVPRRADPQHPETLAPVATD